ncbi:MAG: hypothetical protein U0T84_10835 [Chitinophagales bacterium]
MRRKRTIVNLIAADDIDVFTSILHSVTIVCNQHYLHFSTANWAACNSSLVKRNFAFNSSYWFFFTTTGNP